VHIEDRDGTLREYVSKEAMIGKSVGRWFCSAVEMKPVSVTRPGLVIVKLGNLPHFLAPEFEIFAFHRHEWQGQRENAIQYKIKLGDEKV